VGDADLVDGFAAVPCSDQRVRCEAPRTPVVVQVALVILERELHRSRRRHAKTSGTATSMPWGPTVAMRRVPPLPARTSLSARTMSSSENGRPSYFKIL